MFSTSDTIVAIATPPGRGGIGVVRVSGPCAAEIARQVVVLRAPLEPRDAPLTLFPSAERGEPNGAIDHAIATYFPGPHSYTGEDVVEISAHGSPVVLHAIVASAIAAGA